MGELDRRLAAIASRQRLLITIDDVRRCGGSTDNAAERVAAGRWERVDRGVFLIAGAELDWTTRQLAAVLAAGPGAASSHLAGARLFEWPGFAHAGVELSIPRGRRYRRSDVRSHESTDLDRCQIVQRSGVPVTDPARTLLDLGRYVGAARLGRAVEAARRAGDVTWSDLIATLARHARKGRHGTRRLRRVILRDAHRDEVTDSDLELLLLSMMRDAGLPEPVLHHRVMDGERFVAEVDFAYPRWKIAIECDGAVHREESVQERDLPRQNDLILVGWTVLRYTWKRMQARPDLVVNEIRDAIEGAQRALLAAAAGEDLQQVPQEEGE